MAWTRSRGACLSERTLFRDQAARWQFPNQNYEFPVTEDVDGNIWALGEAGHLFLIKGLKVVEDIQLGESLSSGFIAGTRQNGGVWISTRAGRSPATAANNLRPTH